MYPRRFRSHRWLFQLRWASSNANGATALGVLLLLAIATLASAGFAEPAQAKTSKLKISPDSMRVEIGERARFRITGAKSRCRVSYGTRRARVEGSRSRQFWTFKSETPMDVSFQVRCGSKQAVAGLRVYDPYARAPGDDPPPVTSPSPGPPAPSPPTAPKNPLTGSDGEAQAWWQSVAHYYDILPRGDCVAYAWHRRPDIPERVEKAGYKEWVRDGAPLPQGGSANDAAEPSWHYYAYAVYHPSMNYPSWMWDDLGTPKSAWTTWAAKAGLTVDRVPNIGDIAVSNGHVAVVQEVRANGDYVARQMSSSRPGVVFDTTESGVPSDIRSYGVYFVG